MRLCKDRVWKELHERVVNERVVVNEDHINVGWESVGKSGLWSSRDSEIFNSYPFKLLCEKVEELEDFARS